MPRPNPYEASSCQETNYSCERIFSNFFPPCECRRSRQSVWCPDVISVFGCQPTWLHHTRMEVQSPLCGDCRAAWRVSSATEQECRPRIPSDAQAWLSILVSPVRAGLGGGAAPAHLCDHHRLFGSQRGCPINASGSGIQGLCVPWRSQTQCKRTASTRHAGSSPWVSSEASGSPALLPEV